MQSVFRVVLLVAVALGVGLSMADSQEEPGVMHVVLIWLKDAGNAEHRQQIIAGSKQLQSIPGVLDLRVGEVIPSERAVVDASYDVALSMRFASQHDLQNYLSHPTHQATVRQVFAPIMDRFRVFDFRDQ